MCCLGDNPGCDRSEADKDIVASELQRPDRAAALGYYNTLTPCARAALLASTYASAGSWNSFTDGSLYTWYMEQDSASTSHHTADA
jgi:hypothetical protein